MTADILLVVFKASCRQRYKDWMLLAPELDTYAYQDSHDRCYFLENCVTDYECRIGRYKRPTSPYEITKVFFHCRDIYVHRI